MFRWVLIVLLASGCLLTQRQAARAVEPFGMRQRPAPVRMKDVAAPAVVREAPENESVIVRLPDGELRVFYLARPSGKELRSIASSDGGLTWSAPKVEFELPGAGYHGVQVLLDRDGELHAAFHVFRGDGKQPGVDRNLDVWHSRTTGKRTAWEKPQRLYEGYVGSLRGFLQMKSGRLVLPFARAVPERLKAPPAGQPDLGWHNVIVLNSDDGGRSWKRSPAELTITLTAPNTTRYGAIEPNVIELKDGRVWMLIRDRCGWLYESFSKDGAVWSAPQRTRFVSSDSPACTLRLDDGRLVLFWCANQRWDNPRSYAMGGREVLHAAISADEGKTWQGLREVLHEPAQPAARGDRGTAYPSAVQNREGKIVLVSGQGEGRKAIVLFDADWLTQTTAADDFARGLDQWTHFGAKGVELMDYPDRKGARVLSIRKADAKTPAGAAWNFPTGAGGSVVVRLQLRPGCKGASLALTDHFSVAADTAAEEHAVYLLKIDNQGRLGSGVLRPGQWHEVSVAWEPGEPEAIVTVDGKRVGTLKRLRPADPGINYLRARSARDQADEAGLLIESVKADVAPPRKVEGLPNQEKQSLRLTKVRGPAVGGAALDVGKAEQFDAAWAACPSVLFDGKVYRMWYSSLYDSKMGRGGIGLAASADGVRWERAGEGEPVLEVGREGTFDEGQVMGPEVLFDGKVYRMWYTGMARAWHSSGIGFYRVGLATSADGVHWKRENDGKPVLDVGPAGSPDEVQAATPSILKTDDGYRMWYAAWSPKHGHTVCVARSGDGVRWTRENEGSPVSGLSPAGAYGPAVCRVGDRYLLLYMATGAPPALYAATSEDGLRWTMLNRGEPALKPGAVTDFDGKLLGHPFLMMNGDRLRVWYTGYRTEAGGPHGWKLRVGLAEGKVSIR